jgi:23S rRNA (uracil1939-C5)-methyltransferase
VQTGQKLALKIDSLALGGDGVARHENFTFFVPFSVPGDKLEVKVTEVHKTYGRARITRVVEAGADRVAPPCPVAGNCGGCHWQQLSYPAQAAAKQQFLKDALQRLGKLDQVPLRELVPSGQAFNYRNKAQVPTAPSSPGQPFKMGFYASGSHFVVPLPEAGCAIQPELSNRVLATAGRLLGSAIPAYDEKTGQGSLRHLQVRTNGAGEAMLVLITRMPLADSHRALAESLIKECAGLVSVMNNVQPEKGNVILGNKTFLLAGKESLMEQIGEFRFRLSADSFFQVNSGQVEKLWQILLESRPWTGRETVLELYSGVGTLSLPLAARAGSLHGVEDVAKAVDDARSNAELNQAKNAQFKVGDAGTGFEWLKTEGKKADLLVVDPPRKGLSPEVLATVLANKPAEILYVSCDPGTLARDLGELVRQGGYRLEAVTPLDMFPQTFHVESVTHLRLA